MCALYSEAMQVVLGGLIALILLTITAYKSHQAHSFYIDALRYRGLRKQSARLMNTDEKHFDTFADQTRLL